MSNICPQITVEQFLNYKNVNQDILEEAQSYIDKIVQERKMYRPKPKKNYRKSEWLNKANNYQDDDILYTKFRSILNKVCEQNVRIIANDIKSMAITKEEHFTNLVNFIFEKVKNDKKFVAVYAILVKLLSDLKIVVDGTEHHFIKYFHMKCKVIFDMCISYDVELEQQYTTIETQIKQTEFNFKDQVVSSIEFIGMLFNYKVIGDRIVTQCIDNIVKAIINKKAYSVSIFCTFIKTVATNYNSVCNEQLVYYCKAVKEIQLENIRDKFYVTDIITYLENSLKIVV